MGKRILGLDIQNKALAAVLVDSGLKESRVEAYTYIPFQEESDDPLAAALNLLVEEMPVEGCVCVVSLPADHVSFRNLRVPFRQIKKIKQILPFELEPMLPFPLEEVVIEFHPIKLDGHGEQTDLIAAACNVSGLSSILGLLGARHINPEIVTVSGYPSALCLARLGDLPDNALIVDVRSGSSTIFVMISGQLAMVRALPADRAYESHAEMLGQSIQRTLYAMEETGDRPFKPDKIFVTGPALGENGFEASLARLLNVPTERTDLVRDTQARIRVIPSDSWKPHQMNNALALALIEVIGIKGLNFRKGPFAIKKRWAEYKKNIMVTGGLAAGLLLVWLLTVSIDYYYKTKQLNTLNNRIAAVFQTTFPDVKKIVDPLQQMRVSIEEVRKVSLNPAGGQGNRLIIDILNDISKSIPDDIDVKFSRTVIGEDNVVINGDSDTFNSVDAIKNRIEQSQAFKSVTIVSTTKEDASNRIKFRLKIEF
ncbi:MAG: type II secretion system protein GspL [Deltaproteobacteria bacterium]|nr:type II secretion system protein GspL [Deltaproteobacteria bacterium]